MQLRAKLKLKQDVESDNERLKKELNEVKSRYLDSQKRNCQLQELNREASHALAQCQKDRQKIKSELNELKRTSRQLLPKRNMKLGK